MTPATIIKQAKADGVSLALSQTGSIKAIGNEQAITRWIPLIRERKAELLDVLRNTPDELEILAWMESIGETDPVIFQETLTKCRTNPDALRFFLALARGDDAGRVH